MTKKVSDSSEDEFRVNFQKFKEIFPQFVKEGEVDFNNLHKFFKEQDVLSDKEKYGLSWAGKNNAFKAIKTPSVGTLSPVKEESKNWDNTENIFIEGDNLEVLKLLQKNYREKVKMIYIDPPYNTGHDFVYKDNFTESVADYYEKTGQTENGVKMSVNTEKNGRFHSDWLTMMYPRLFLARNLLKEDGVIFVSIDDNEVANLRLICDEIFGEENFIEIFSWEKTETPPNLSKLSKKNLEYILCYKKTNLRKFLLGMEKVSDSSNGLMNQTNSAKRLVFPANIIDTGIEDGLITKGEYGTKNYKIFLIEDTKVKNGVFVEPVILEGKFKWTQQNLDKEIKNGTQVSIRTKSLSPSYDRREYSPEAPWNIINREFGVGTNENASEELDMLFGLNEIFDHPKPPSLIKYLLAFLRDSKKDNDLFMDFFAGSGTTAHAVMDLNAEDGGNRKYICVQLPESTDEDSEAYKAGYKNIADISKERIRRAGEKVKEENKDKEGIENLDIGFKVFKLQNSAFRKWNVLTSENNLEDVKKQAKLFIEKPLVDKYKEEDVVQEVLLKEGFSLNSKVEQRNTKSKVEFFFVKDVENSKVAFVTFEEKLTKEKIEELEIPKDILFVCFDSALDDNLKVNISRNLNLKVI